MRRFGVEIELIGGTNDMRAVAARLTQEGIATVVQSYNHNTAQTWKIVSDGSVIGAYGMELVSPILEGQAGLDTLKRVGEILTAMGCTVNRTCGLHVHVEARDLSADQVKNVLRMWCKYEAHYDSIMPASRRGSANTYCRSVVGQLAMHSTSTGDQIDRAFKAIKSARGLNGLHRMFGGRFFKVNLESLSRHGTIEFRHHSGTLDSVKLVNWATLVNAVVCRAVETRCVMKSGHDKFERAFRLAGGDVIRWARRRVAHFAGNANAEAA